MVQQKTITEHEAISAPFMCIGLFLALKNMDEFKDKSKTSKMNYKYLKSRCFMHF
jgi:hypothetical protein